MSPSLFRGFAGWWIGSPNQSITHPHVPKLHLDYLSSRLLDKYATPTRHSYLDKLVNEKFIKPSSRDWLTCSLDPFHDFQFTPAGLPDQFSGASVVQFIKKKVSIVAPAGTTDKWDCHIFTAPLMTSQTAHNYMASPASLTMYSTWTSGLGTVNVYSVPAGTDTMPNGAASALPAASLATCYSPCDDGNAYSLMRLVGGGFEVHNDTAELYLNGSVTTYSQPTDLEDTFGSCQIGANYGAVLTTRARIPPYNVSQATSNVSSMTWSAKEGCYVPFIIDVESCKLQQAISNPLILCTTDSSNPGYGAAPALGVETDLFTYGTTIVGRSDAPVRFASIETNGAYFTGLTKETVLTLDIRFIVEVAPTPINTTLIALASPSAAYDPEALALYSRAIRELPPGVKASMNAGGDWWRIVSGAINYAAPIIARLGPYGAGAAAIAKGAQAVGDTVQQRRNEKRVKEVEEGRRGTQNPRVSAKPPQNSDAHLRVTRPVTKDKLTSGSWKPKKNA